MEEGYEEGEWHNHGGGATVFRYRMQIKQALETFQVLQPSF